MIKTTRELVVQRSICYPKLMIGKNSSSVVLFIKKGHGVRLSPDGHDFGDYVCDWDMDCFVDYNGSVTISNS